MRISIIAMAALIAFFGLMTPGDVNAQPNPNVPRVLPLDSRIAEFSVLESRNAQFGIVPNPPGGGPPAFYVSNAKVPNDIRYEFQFVLDAPVDARNYPYLVFEMMGDTWEIMNDINEHYPRFRVNDTYVQFQGSHLFRKAIDEDLNGNDRQWITVSVPIAPFNVHANRNNFAPVMSNMSIFLLRFITNRPPVQGRLYFRNIRLQMEP